MILGIESTAHTFGGGRDIRNIYSNIEIFIYYNILYNLMRIGEFIRKLRKSGTSLSINLPPEIIELMKLKKDDILKVKIEKVNK